MEEIKNHIDINVQTGAVNTSNIIDILEHELFEKNLIKSKIDREIFSKVNVVGFDIDHTLVLYNIDALTELMYNSFAKFLVEHKNYPKEILIYPMEESKEDLDCDINEREKNRKFNLDFVHGFSGIEIVLDLKNGNAIKIDENRIVQKAFHGIEELTREQIEKVYGSEREFLEFNMDSAKGINYHSVLSNFEYHAIPIFLMCVHLYEIGTFKLVDSEPFKKIFSDILEGFLFNYILYNAEEKRILKMSESKGYFFPELDKNLKKYILDYSAKEMLTHLRSKGVQIFFATNSYYEHADVILKETIGEDYLDYFDLAVFYSQKPSFFYKDSKSPAYFPEFSVKDHKGEIVTSENVKEDTIYQRLKSEKTLIEGSYQIVEEFFKKKTQKDDLKYIFVGDNLFADIYHTSNLANWSSIGVLDEIKTGYLGNIPEEFKQFWKSESLGLDLDHPKSNSFFTKVSREKNLFAVSNVDILKHLN
jgi:hypothetical protein